jgi:HAE1 family hydrophobic/amphiphilic exporter-1
MAALFESFTQPLAIIITLPLAFFGAFWALWLLDFVLDPVAFFGVILLIGIVVNNGIVMVNHVNALRRHGRERVEALIEGCGDRLRPVLMTAITTIFGILPLGFSAFTVRGAPMGSLSTVIAGGLATSTLFTLIGLPVWYTMIEDIGSMIARLLPSWKTKRPKSETHGLMTD